MKKQAIFRFAPSPNGELHLGHAYSALLNLSLARAVDGKILLRIEDIDTLRCTPALEKQMLEDLEWIGFEWDEPPRRQSEHFEEYRDTLIKLAKTDLLYVSTLSRGEIKAWVSEFESDGKTWPRDPDGVPIYPGTDEEREKFRAQQISETLGKGIIRLNNKKAANRMDPVLFWKEFGLEEIHKETQTSGDIRDWGDIILARRDTPTSYHLSCVVDDALQGVTHIVRGKDLYHATAIHRLLQILLGSAEPAYHHHDLVLNQDNEKLSKSSKDTSLRQLRNSGKGKNQILEMIGLA